MFVVMVTIFYLKYAMSHSNGYIRNIHYKGYVYAIDPMLFHIKMVVFLKIYCFLVDVKERYAHVGGDELVLEASFVSGVVESVSLSS